MKSLLWAAGLVATVSVFADSPTVPTTTAAPAIPVKTVDPVQPIFANTIIPEIRLNSAELITGAKFLGASASGANFLIGRSLRTIPFALLPSDLAKRTMLFADQSKKAEDARRAAHRDTDDQIELAHALAVTKVQERVAQNQQDSENAARLAQEASQHQQMIRADAEKSAYNYFQHEWRPGNNSVYIMSVDVAIDDVQPRAGWDGEWDVNGQALIKYYISSGNSYSSANQRFTAVLKEKGSAPHFVPTLF